MLLLAMGKSAMGNGTLIFTAILLVAFAAYLLFSPAVRAFQKGRNGPSLEEGAQP